ncbi:MAG: DJ-1/PfpI family protein [Lachnospiraceae bacterium]|nr:DJ-1/PfpI family protein [Lachnospiraceae bacterium]
MAKVYVLLANGFEEIEGLTVVDILRRGRVDVETVSIEESLNILGSHSIKLEADVMFDDADFEAAEMIVLPGGLRGTNALMEHKGLKKLLQDYKKAGKWISAICAAPSVLGMNGILEGKKAICYPGFEEKLLGAMVVPGAKVVKDGKVITSRGMGTAIDFALVLLETLSGSELAQKISKGIQFT